MYSYLVSISGRQVLLVKEAFLQLKDLVVGESCARLALLLCLLPRTEQLSSIATAAVTATTAAAATVTTSSSLTS